MYRCYSAIAVSLSLVLNIVLAGPAAAASHGGGLPACAKPTAARAGCFAKLLRAAPASAPSGYGPAQLRAAYGAAGTGSANIAIVAAYADPSIKNDLDTYSRRFGLPVMSDCTASVRTSCFLKMNQSGGASFPRANAGWALETALDVETVHGICPGCRIDLVEATSAAIPDLMTAVDQAVRSGAQVVSMSWGGAETAIETTADEHFVAGISFVASSGDSGYGAAWPAASPRVIAVGGTHLSLSGTGHRLAESAWSGSGSGCSKYELKPAWQHDPACARRSIADLSAVADPATGAAIFSSLSLGGSGWFTVGGTSLAAPVVAGLIGLAGSRTSAGLVAHMYGSLGSGRLFDVTSGSNGACANYLCRSMVGYDGPTGIGSPLRLNLF